MTPLTISASTAQSEKREIEVVLHVHVLFDNLDSPSTSSKDLVPESCLFAIVAALPPSLAVMQVVVLDDELHAEKLKERRVDTRSAGIDS